MARPILLHGGDSLVDLQKNIFSRAHKQAQRRRNLWNIISKVLYNEKGKYYGLLLQVKLTKLECNLKSIS